MHKHDCLSLMEILELRDQATDDAPEAFAHVHSCPRCGALLAHLPEVHRDDVRLPTDLPAAKGRLAEERPDEVGAGQLWLATAPRVDDWRFPVAVIGRPRQRPGTVLVAPVDEDISAGTDADLIVRDSPLGYPHLLNVWNFGVIFDEQLEDYIGALDPDLTAALRSLYAFIAADQGEAPSSVGPPVTSADDPRRRHRDERARWTRTLYAPARNEGVSVEDEETVAEGEGEVADVVTFSRCIERAFASQEWDFTTLIESAQLPATLLERFLRDDLDLSHQRDVEPLARTLIVLHYDVEEVKEPLWNSLAASSGGWVKPSEGPQAMAARSFAHVTPEERNRALYEDQHGIDASDEGRARAIRSYWEALVEKYEELR
jgi:hypothetical protein